MVYHISYGNDLRMEIQADSIAHALVRAWLLGVAAEDIHCIGESRGKKEEDEGQPSQGKLFG